MNETYVPIYAQGTYVSPSNEWVLYYAVGCVVFAIFMFWIYRKALKGNKAAMITLKVFFVLLAIINILGVALASMMVAEDLDKRFPKK